MASSPQSLCSRKDERVYGKCSLFAAITANKFFNNTNAGNCFVSASEATVIYVMSIYKYV